MRTYVDITFSSDGTIPTVVAERLRELAGVSILVGHHDVAFDWTDVAEFRQKVKAIHDALVGTHATYRVETIEDDDGSSRFLTWPPAGNDNPAENPGFRSQRRPASPGGDP